MELACDLPLDVCSKIQINNSGHDNMKKEKHCSKSNFENQEKITLLVSFLFFGKRK